VLFFCELSFFNIDAMTLSSQMEAASGSRKSSKKVKAPKKASTTKTTPPPKDDTKKNTASKPKKPSVKNDKMDTLSVQNLSLRRNPSMREKFSNFVHTGATSLKRSFSFGKGLNDLSSKKPWHNSLHSLHEDVHSIDGEDRVFVPERTDSSGSEFDYRKPVTRTQSLLVQKTRTNNDAAAKRDQVSCYYCLVTLR
jgi:hypothetical protein